MNIGSLIKDKRLTCGLSQNDLAANAGMSRSTIINFETGKRSPRVDDLKSIARALAMNPQLLYFDEPTSALDPELTGEVLKVLKQLAAEDTTMIVVTHEMAFARDVADRVVFMDGGVIVEEGPAEQVMDAPAHERTREFLSRFSG